MSWVRIDDKSPRHPKVKALSDRAFRFWLMAICYASEYLTDGIVPQAFLLDVPEKVRGELLAAGLWRPDAAGDLRIHDYLEYQASRESVEHERARNRKRKRYSRPGTGGTPAGVPEPPVHTPVHAEVPAADAAGTPPRLARPPALIRSPLEFDRARQRCAFVGARLEVPKKLHADLVRDTGGADAEGRLQAWYATVDAGLESSGEPIVPDVFKWLTARWRVWVAPAALASDGVMDAEQTRQMLARAAAKAGA